MIIIDNVTKKFGKDKTAVDHTTWKVEDGKITGFFGPNGAGKTTTLKMITGVLPIDEGKIEINGNDISKNPLEAKKQFGFVSDSPDHFLQLKGIEYLNYIASLYEVPVSESVPLIEEMAERFEMESALNDKIMSYSHGMRQKIMVIGALVHNPSIWILDEPMTGLDPQSAHILKEMMKEHANSGKTVLFSTHVLPVAESLCDNVVIINHGNLMFNGTLDELKTSYPSDMSLEDIFLRMTADEENN